MRVSLVILEKHIKEAQKASFRNTLFFYIRTSNFGAEAERSYFFHDLRLKMFSRRSSVTCCSISVNQCGRNQETYQTALSSCS